MYVSVYCCNAGYSGPTSSCRACVAGMQMNVCIYEYISMYIKVYIHASAVTLRIYTPHTPRIQIHPVTYRVAKTHRMPYLYRTFSQKSPIIIGSFAKNDLQLKASYGSLPPCMEWLRSVGSIESQVSFTEYRLFYRAHLQKRPIILDHFTLSCHHSLEHRTNIVL